MGYVKYPVKPALDFQSCQGVFGVGYIAIGKYMFRRSSALISSPKLVFVALNPPHKSKNQKLLHVSVSHRFMPKNLTKLLGPIIWVT
jgi:hypothetical protein